MCENNTSHSYIFYKVQLNIIIKNRKEISLKQYSECKMYVLFKTFWSCNYGRSQLGYLHKYLSSSRGENSSHSHTTVNVNSDCVYTDLSSQLWALSPFWSYSGYERGGEKLEYSYQLCAWYTTATTTAFDLCRCMWCFLQHKLQQFLDPRKTQQHSGLLQAQRY